MRLCHSQSNRQRKLTVIFVCTKTNVTNLGYHADLRITHVSEFPKRKIQLKLSDTGTACMNLKHVEPGAVIFHLERFRVSPYLTGRQGGLDESAWPDSLPMEGVPGYSRKQQ